MKRTIATKRIIAAVLVLVVIVASFAVLAACNRNNDMTNEPWVVPEGGYDGSEVNIRFDHTMGQLPAPILEKYIAEFNKLYPNIHVTSVSVGDYPALRDNIITQLQGDLNTVPHIAYCYPDHVALFNESYQVAILDNLIASEEVVERADGTTETLGLTADQKADFIQVYYNEGKSYGDDYMYAMPFSKSTDVLYYNKDYFKENNISVPTTWEEMEAVCAQIKEKEGAEVTPLGVDSEANLFITMCEQLGSPYTSASGDHYLFDNETNKNFVRMFADWYSKGYLTTKTILKTYTSSAFKEKKLYMAIGSSAGATKQTPTPNADQTYPWEVGIASLPQVDPSNPKVISQGPSVCIFKKSNPQEVIASWLLVKYLTTTIAFQAEFSQKTGYMPVIQSAFSHPTYEAFLSKANGKNNIAALSVKTCYENLSALYTSPAFNGSSKARDQVNALMVAAMGGADIDQLFKAAIEECEY